MPEGADVLRELLISIGIFTDPGAEEALDRLNTATDQLRENAKAMAQATGGATVATAALKEEERLAKIEVDRATAAADRQRRVMTQLTGVVDTLARGFVAASTALVGLVAGGAVLATNAGRNAEAIERQAASLQLSTDAVQELQFAFGVFDAGGELFAQTLLTIQDRATQALNGSQQLVESFGALGISVRDLRTLNPEQRFEALAEGLASATDQGAALSAVFRTLGEDVGRRLTPMLLEGAAGVRQLREEARELGLVTDRRTLRASAELALQWRRLTQVGRALREEIGQALVPTVERITDRTLAWIRANREALSGRIQLFVEGLAGSMDVLLGIVGGLTVAFVGLKVAIAGVRIGSAVVAFAAANPVLAAILVVVGLLITAFVSWGLVLEDLIFWVRGYNSAIGETLRYWASWLPFGEKLFDVFAAGADVVRSAASAVVRLGAAFLQNTGPVQALLGLIERFVDKFGLVRGIFNAVSSLVDAGLEGAATDLRGLARSIDAGADTGMVAVNAQGQVARTNNTTNTTNLTQNVNVESPGGVSSGVADFIDGVLRNGRAATAGGVR